MPRRKRHVTAGARNAGISSLPDSCEARSKADYILGRLRADIVSGHLGPGEKLPFRELTARYGVSGSPLREALCLLAGDGLVELESQRGFRVAPVSSAELADICTVRRNLECLAFGQAVDHGDARWRADIVAARAAFSRVIQKVGDNRPITEEWEARHRTFHFALIAACGSPILLHLCGQIHDRFDRYRRLAIPVRSFMAGTASDHDDLVEAALAGARDRALAVLCRHIDDIAALVTANFTSRPAARPPALAGDPP